jgi:hypothetical protein
VVSSFLSSLHVGWSRLLCTIAALCLIPYNCLQLLVDQQLAEPDDENLKKRHSSADLSDEGYFEYYEESLEWYFDPELYMQEPWI